MPAGVCRQCNITHHNRNGTAVPHSKRQVSCPLCGVEVRADHLKDQHYRNEHPEMCDRSDSDSASASQRRRRPQSAARKRRRPAAAEESERSTDDEGEPESPSRQPRPRQQAAPPRPAINIPSMPHIDNNSEPMCIGMAFKCLYMIGVLLANSLIGMHQYPTSCIAFW
jgi:hypothetical protein